MLSSSGIIDFVSEKVYSILKNVIGASETTIYVIAIYGSKLKNKNIKPAMIIGFIADFICVISCIIALKIGII